MRRAAIPGFCGPSAVRYASPGSDDLLCVLNSPLQLVPASEVWGRRVDRRRVSRIRSYDGKMWQARTVEFRGEHFVAPFIINGGGISCTRPILSPFLLERVASVPREKVENSGGCEVPYWATAAGGSFSVPSPLGKLKGFSNWPADRAAEDCRGNLIGHGLADLVQLMKGFAVSVREGFMTVEQAVRALELGAEDDVKMHWNTDAVKEELQLMIDAYGEAESGGECLLELVKRRWLV
jgi:hypothetical protein